MKTAYKERLGICFDDDDNDKSWVQYSIRALSSYIHTVCPSWQHIFADYHAFDWPLHLLRSTLQYHRQEEYNPRISHQHNPNLPSAVRPRPPVCGGIPEGVSSFPIEHPISTTSYGQYIPHRTAHGRVPVSWGWTGGPSRSRDGPFNGFTMRKPPSSIPPLSPWQKWAAGCSVSTREQAIPDRYGCLGWCH